MLNKILGMWDDTGLHARLFTTWNLFHVPVWNLGAFSESNWCGQFNRKKKKVVKFIYYMYKYNLETLTCNKLSISHFIFIIILLPNWYSSFKSEFK